MNAIAVPPRRYGPPTASVAAGEAEHAAMARNRQGTPPRVTVSPSINPLDTTAFRMEALRRRVNVFEALHSRAKAAASAGDKASRDKARKAVRKAGIALTSARRDLALESRSEDAAPAVQRADIVQPGAHAIEYVTAADGRTTKRVVRQDILLREARAFVVPASGRVQLVTVLDRLHARGSITRDQQEAGRLYRRAWEMAGMDAYPVGLGEFGGCAPSSGNRRIEDAVGSGAALAKVRLRLPLVAVNLIEWVVIEEMEVAAWAARQVTPRGRAGMNAQQAMGMLCMALDMIGVRP